MDTPATPKAESHLPIWRPNRLRQAAAALLMPLIYVVNRPALAWFGRACLELALRFNGIAINFNGSHGLTAGEERFLARRLRRHEQGVLVDVGANAGSYALRLRALCPDARIVAFEPHPKTFAALAAKTASARIEVLNQAVGDSAGQLTLYDFADADGSTQASLTRAAITLFSENVVRHDVECTTIDAFMAGHGIDRIALLKIDTEGHDIGVLRGAAFAIAARTIDVIQFEVIPANVATRVFVRDFFDALPGYKLHRLCLNGELLPLPRYDTKHCEIFLTHNLVALRD